MHSMPLSSGSRVTTRSVNSRLADPLVMLSQGSWRSVVGTVLFCGFFPMLTVSCFFYFRITYCKLFVLCLLYIDCFHGEAFNRSNSIALFRLDTVRREEGLSHPAVRLASVQDLENSSQMQFSKSCIFSILRYIFSYLF